jgi:MYXO-CTERM domain-containing protein
MMRKWWTAGAAFAAVVLCAVPVRATTVTYDLSVEFSGATPPAGAAPWLRATFDDGGGAGSVTLTLAAVNLVGGEFVSDWDFNLDPALNPASLSFSAPTKTGTFGDPVITFGVDAFQADGDGRYDIEVEFDTAPPGDRFGAGESVQYTITGIATLTASSFDFLSAPAGGSGPFPTAAHVQGIGPEGANSGWVTVPEPAAAWLALLGVGAAVARRATRRMGHRQS